ncbi:Box C/D snoRNA accumulation [Kalmusia sp. IMI 367209]|nr:Box C/D snoRNA accumulation [Kalmusia sp. IMI 367209]
MADDALLSDLCSICTLLTKNTSNTAKFKYRCPGCSARTCSLPCYKRHQQWAQCNGKRDPTKYVKKSQLSTPSGIDHDYNFLTSIERSLERAERQVEDRGLGSLSGPRRDAQIRQPADQHYAAAGVTVVRAPKGLSRQKENKTHRSKKGYIVWTVEWIHQDTTRVLTESSSAVPILQTQPFKQSAKATKKRKRDIDQATSTTESVNQDVSPSIQVQDGISRVKEEDAQSELPPGGTGPEQVSLDISTGDGTTDHATATEGGEVKIADDHHGGLCSHGSESESVSPKYSFYLLKPRTSSHCHVLIPLEPTAPLADCLRGRTVLEFPTIYVFPITVSPPPEQFMLEAQYLQQEGEEQQEFEDIIKNVSPQTLRALNEQHSNDNADDDINSDRILDVLKQDIGAGL